MSRPSPLFHFKGFEWGFTYCFMNNIFFFVESWWIYSGKQRIHTRVRVDSVNTSNMDERTPTNDHPKVIR